MIFCYGTMTPKVAKAASSGELRAQVNNLQAQIDASKAKLADLGAQEDSLKKTIGALDEQINQAVIQIQLYDAKIAELQDKLDQTQKELDRQKDLLKESMRTLYKKKGASTVELLASSDSFSQFIDQQEYLERLKGSIQTSAEQVIDLKKQIETEQDQQKQLRQQQEDQKRDLDAKRADRANVLAQTQGDEANYHSMLENLKAQQLKVNQQLAAQMVLESGNGTNGGYPYNNWPFSMAGPGCVAGDGPDRWGYCTRQCVSYAAWAVERSGRHAPMYYGNANMWVGSARADGIPVDTTPRTGDVAIFTGGNWGHAQYVDAVYGDGTMRISQYNILLDGRYSEATVSTSRSGWYYIHFP